MNQQEKNKLDKKLMSKDKKLNAQIKNTQFVQKQTQRHQRLTTLLTSQQAGYLEAEENEKTLQFRQNDIKNLIPIQNKAKIFDLDLELGSYKIDFSLNGNVLALGSSQGHLALLQWKNKNLLSEINVKEKIRDVKFLQNHNTVAVAQQKYVYIYDNDGTELHKLKSHIEPSHLEYLPYHFLLASSSRLGFLKYHDISTGSIVAEYRTKVRDPCSMGQNPTNGIVYIGDNKGQVTLYSPNTSEPLVSMLCHKSNVSSLNVHQNGHYLVTSSNDGTWKVWDNRNYKMVYEYWSPQIIKNSSMSQRGLLALSMNNSCQIWKDWYLEKQKAPYMKQESYKNKAITDCQFVNFEDFLGFGLDNGFQSVCIPGSGSANYDSFEFNPLKTKKQEAEDLVHKLMEKLPSTTIGIDQNMIGKIDTASKDVIEKEEKLEEQQRLSKQQKKKRRKMRGRQKSGRVENAKDIEAEKKVYEKRNQHVNILVRQKNAEKEKKKSQIQILTELEDNSGFDPLALIQKSKKIKKQ